MVNTQTYSFLAIIPSLLFSFQNRTRVARNSNLIAFLCPFAKRSGGTLHALVELTIVLDMELQAVVWRGLRERHLR